MLTCSVCEQECEDQAKLSRHQRDCHGSRIFCPVQLCFYSVPKSRNYRLIEHLDRKHKDAKNYSELKKEIFERRMVKRDQVEAATKTSVTLRSLIEPTIQVTATIPQPVSSTPIHEGQRKEFDVNLGSPLHLDFTLSSPPTCDLQWTPPNPKTPKMPSPIFKKPEVPQQQVTTTTKIFQSVHQLSANSPVSPLPKTPERSASSTSIQKPTKIQSLPLPPLPIRKLTAPTLTSEMKLTTNSTVTHEKETETQNINKDVPTIPKLSTQELEVVAEPPSSPERKSASVQTVPTFPPKPIKLEREELYAAEAFDPRLIFRNAPSELRRSFPSGPLRKIRRDLPASKNIRHVATTQDVACVMKEEMAVLPDGTRYTMRTVWVRDIDYSIKKEKGIQLKSIATELDEVPSSEPEPETKGKRDESTSGNLQNPKKRPRKEEAEKKTEKGKKKNEVKKKTPKVPKASSKK